MTAESFALAFGTYISVTIQDELYQKEGFYPKLLPITLNACSSAFIGSCSGLGIAGSFAFGAVYSTSHLTSRFLIPDSDVILGIAKYVLDILVSSFFAWCVLEICGIAIPFTHAVMLGTSTFVGSLFILLFASIFVEI